MAFGGLFKYLSPSKAIFSHKNYYIGGKNMKNKLIIAIATIALLTVATVAMASSGITLSPKPIVTETVFTPSFDRLASYMGYDTDEKFEEFHSTALFMGKYCTTGESFSFIENMILSGCDVQTTIDIYQFYLTTNEPISIVKQIYDMVYTGEPITNRDVVFENAFNTLTNNKCGVLTEEDIIEYIEKGLSVDDIVQANLLCRKAVMTIQEILDARLSGTSWENIIETVSGEDITLSENADVSQLTYALNTAAVTNEPINTAVNNSEFFEQKTKEVNEILKEKGYWKGRKSENYKFLVEKAKVKGISEEKLNALLDSGCSEIDLLNSIESPNCTPSSIDTIVKERSVK